MDGWILKGKLKGGYQNYHIFQKDIKIKLITQINQMKRMRDGFGC